MTFAELKMGDKFCVIGRGRDDLFMKIEEALERIYKSGRNSIFLEPHNKRGFLTYFFDHTVVEVVE